MIGLNKLTQFNSTELEKYYMFLFSLCDRVGYMGLVTEGSRKRFYLKLLISKKT